MVLKNCKVLVTGATGFIGSNLIRELIVEGYEVHILTREKSDTWRIKDVLNKISNHTGNLMDFLNLKKIVEEIQPKIIFHLATASIYGGRHLPGMETINTNFIGTFNLISACNNINYKCFVNTGTSSEYGPKNRPMKENDLCEPVNMYGVTKLASTLYGKHIAKLKDKPIVTLRLFSPFGPYDNQTRLITYAILKALKDEDLQLADPNAVRDYIYVKDVIQFYIRMINKAEKLKGEIFNVALGKEVKSSYVIEKILELTNSKSKILWGKTVPRPFDTPHWEADMNKSKNILDIRTQIGFDEGLKKTIEWFKGNIRLYNNKFVQ